MFFIFQLNKSRPFFITPIYYIYRETENKKKSIRNKKGGRFKITPSAFHFILISLS